MKNCFATSVERDINLETLNISNELIDAEKEQLTDLIKRHQETDLIKTSKDFL